MFNPLRRYFEKQFNYSKSTYLGTLRFIVWYLKLPYRLLRGRTLDLRIGPVQGRSWRSGIPLWLMKSLMTGYTNYRYNGLRMIKHPIDIALYQILIQELKPMSIIEIGSKEGGTAIWLADHSNAMVYSIDLAPPNITHSRVRFLSGDESDLRAILPWSDLPHPWLIINDASHRPAPILACLTLLDRYAILGDYLIVEDGFISELGVDRAWGGGPAQAIATFLSTSKHWKIDSRYCDHFGYNVTGNPNGYLRRV